MLKLFWVRDRTKRSIYLSDERWKHIIIRHPEVNDIEEIKETVLKPLMIKQDKFDEF